MVLAYFQNHADKFRESQHFIQGMPDIFGFLEFYSQFDHEKFAIIIDLSPIFRDEPRYQRQTNFKTIVPYYDSKKGSKREDENPLLYIKDPIGKIFYSDPSEYHLYRDNIAQGAFSYTNVILPHFKKSYEYLKEPKITFWKFINN